MEDQSGKAAVNIQEDRAYFEKVCPVRAATEKIRVQEQSIPGSHFEIFFHLFRKLRELPYQPTSEQRYECLFDIVRMGNCADEGNLTDNEDNGFFQIIKLYRHRIVHGFHAITPERSDELINAFINYLKTFSDEGRVELFKNDFQKVANDNKLYKYINKGNKGKIITKVLSQMKYFFEKAKLFSEQGKLDAASLAYIAGAICGLDIENFYIMSLKTDKNLNLKKCSATKAIEHYSERDLKHIAELLLIIQDLKAKRKEFFAHQGSSMAKNDSDAFLRNTFLKNYDEDFVQGLYVKISRYLEVEFHTQLLVLEEGSPRAYDPETIKGGAIAPGRDKQKDRIAPPAFLGRSEEEDRPPAWQDSDFGDKHESKRRREEREKEEEPDRDYEQDQGHRRSKAEHQEGSKRLKDQDRLPPPDAIQERERREQERREQEKRREERRRREEEDRRRRRAESEERERRESEKRRAERKRREEQDRRDREDEGGGRRKDSRDRRDSDDRRNDGGSRRSFKK